ncbi:MAG: hypothetical protein COB36_08805 [Alphaproteobacteria bacterium]|nr:MAG: hypothetical protein COB36_08805 [Alphaproteobacteria bacterium]
MGNTANKFIILLRAVNVGGTGKLPMSMLKNMCVEEGFEKVKTYIASGNVVFETDMSGNSAQAALATRLEEYAGKPVGVIIRTPAEMAQVLKANPFPNAAPNHNVAIFFDQCLPADTLQHVKGQKDEELSLGKREIYVHYGAGMGKSKLKIPMAKDGTARNMNTIAKLIDIVTNL